MNPSSPTEQNQQQNIPLQTLQPGEQVIFQIKRHPFGIVVMFVGIGTMLALLAIIAFVVGPSIFPNVDKGTYNGIAAIGFLIFTFLCLVVAALANHVYWGNTWTLTSDSLTQVVQTSLFNKQSSQLSLESLEDVSAAKNGIMAHVFNFGLLKAETAGEHSKFHFPYCSNPDYYAQKILQAREVFEKHGGHEVYAEGQEVSTTHQPTSTLPTDQNQHQS